jgi:hypothetical protein
MLRQRLNVHDYTIQDLDPMARYTDEWAPASHPSSSRGSAASRRRRDSRVVICAVHDTASATPPAPLPAPTNTRTL